MLAHIHGELLKQTAGLNMVHVPYRGSVPMTTDLIANTIPIGIPLMPDVPTMIELTQPKLVLENFFGLSGPPKLPVDVVTSLNAACNEVLAMPEIHKKLTELGIVGKPESVATFNDFVRAQVGVLEPTVKGAGIKL